MDFKAAIATAGVDGRAAATAVTAAMVDGKAAMVVAPAWGEGRAMAVAAAWVDGRPAVPAGVPIKAVMGGKAWGPVLFVRRARMRRAEPPQTSGSQA